eukprot:SAG31_NODE_12852_length_911_cov_2.093596_1_plen_197_part_01
MSSSASRSRDGAAPDSRARRARRAGSWAAVIDCSLMEQLAAGVVEVVQCDQDVAMRALQFTGGDMQDAIALLLENNGEVPDMDDLGDYSQEEEDAAQLLDGGQAEFDNDDDSGSGLEDELDAMAEASAANEDRSGLLLSPLYGTFPAESPVYAPSNPGLIEKVSPCRPPSWRTSATASRSCASCARLWTSRSLLTKM